MPDGRLQYEITGDGSNFARMVDGCVNNIALMGARFLAFFAIAEKVGAAAARGLSFNREVSDARVAIGNIIRRFQGLNEEAAKCEAAKAMEQIKDLEPQVA